MTYKEPLLIGVGAAIGSAVTMLVMKKHYQAKADNEIEEMRAAYNRRLSELSERNRNKPVPDMEDFIAEVTTPEPTKDARTSEIPPEYAAAKEREATPEEVETVVQSKPGPVLESITQDDFLEHNGYDKVDVVVYADGIAADESTDDILDVDETIGIDAVPRIIRGHEEVIYIRNNDLMIDYEIYGNDDTYSDVTGIQVRG